MRLNPNRLYAVTGVPDGAQEAAAQRGAERHARESLEGRAPRLSTKHRVRGQQVRVVSGSLVARVEIEFQRKGLRVTVRRWRPK